MSKSRKNLKSRKTRSGLVAGVALAGVTAAVATFGAGAANAEQQGEIRGAGAANAVGGSYIVVLKPTAVGQGVAAAHEITANVAAKAQGLTGQYGTTLSRTFGSALNGFSIKADEAAAKRLAADPQVAYVVQNKTFKISETQDNPPSWGLDRVDQADLPLDDKYTYPTKADNVTAYVIDTGVRGSHKDFGDRATGGKDFVDNDDTPNDEHGHGTHVAGTIGGTDHGLAKGVKIVGVRVLDANGSGTTEGVVAGVDWVAANAKGPSVANMSLGGGADDALDAAVKGAIDKGVTFALAAGNESSDAGTTSPARVKEAITVAASDKTDKQASFSNYGSVVDLYAPGVDITSSWATGDDATNTISGTSMAAPHVAGAAALYLSANPEATPAQVAEGLVGAAADGKISNPTGGTANKLLQVK
ncbi:S8 family peptidase [Amycolatopsis roodepoortensis]|uniref:S8 family peptidase n=1 Tax=Amycolatopsis roodepoortensis TaxID=700274 RepID=UPI000F87609D|nr:S8 family peptidase [Amycolatopsis roodepoortensis]RSN12244.1 serine protease [Streptomyces sp. WAC 05977]UUV34562.1 S8 family peptidase [Amycolatopsis roodepoortensis]